MKQNPHNSCIYDIFEVEMEPVGCFQVYGMVSSSQWTLVVCLDREAFGARVTWPSCANRSLSHNQLQKEEKNCACPWLGSCGSPHCIGGRIVDLCTWVFCPKTISFTEHESLHTLSLSLLFSMTTLFHDNVFESEFLCDKILNFSFFFWVLFCWQVQTQREKINASYRC